MRTRGRRSEQHLNTDRAIGIMTYDGYYRLCMTSFNARLLSSRDGAPRLLVNWASANSMIKKGLVEEVGKEGIMTFYRLKRD